MSGNKPSYATYLPGIAVALIVAFALAACLGGGGGSEQPAGTVVASGSEAAAPVPVGYPTPPAIPALPVAIGSWADPGGGVTRVTTPPTGIANGDAVQISGVTNLCCTGYNAIFNVSNVTGTGFDIPITYLGDGGSAFTITQIIAGGALPVGGAANCPTTGNTGVITLNAAAARFSGVAPLAVFFDAGATTATTTALPFHDLEYRWTFGDAAVPWTYGSRAGVSSRNQAIGPIASHVFETPGTYKVTLTVTDGTNTVTNDCIQIAVLDPDVVFAGNKTICLSSAGNFAGCPAGAQQVTHATANFTTAINTYVATGKRLLFRTGETWTSPSKATLGVTGPGIIGSFGGGVKPIIQATGNATILEVSGGNSPGLSDWRIMDLEFDGLNGTSSQGIASNGGFDQLTLFRLKMHDLHIGVNFPVTTLNSYNSNPATAGHHLYDQFAIVDSTFDHAVGVADSYMGYVAGARFSFQGNWADNSTLSHVLRFPQVSKGVISNNTAGRPVTARHVIKLHAPGFALGNGYTEQVVISDNKLIGDNNDWTVSIEPQNAQSDERIRNVIVERNWFKAGVGTRRALIMSGVQLTIRNNIEDMTGGVGFTCTEIGQRGVEPAPADVRFYNNTCYNGLASSNVTALLIGSTVTNVTARNNLAAVLSGGTGTMISGTGASGLAQSDNTFFPTAATAFVSAAPAVPADFALTVARLSAFITAPVHSDFRGNARPQVGNDIGAMVFP